MTNKYSAREKDLIRMLVYQGKSDKEIAELMGRTVWAIRRYRTYRLRLLRPHPLYKKWTKSQLDFIKNYWQELSDAKMARKLGVSEYCYQQKRRSMGLQKEPSGGNHRRRSWKFSDHIFLLENYGKMTAAEIGSHIGRSKGAVRSHMYLYRIEQKGGAQ